MIITKNLLKTFIKPPKDIYNITYNNITEVEAFEKINDATKLVIGHVLTCVDHPNSDHLHVTTVDLGDRVEQIVCGAPNVEKGQYVIVAQVGSVLPGNFEIKASTIRGETSNGMICSLNELGFEEAQIPKRYKDGIYYFDTPQKIGTPALEALHLDGWKMTLGLTPNRSDLLSTLGFAYDLGAMTNQAVKVPKYSCLESDIENPLTVTIDSDGCGRYYARYLDNIEVKESPWWLKSELIARGMHPINNVVDISNYVLLTYGTPLHMFDAKKVNAEKIVVRDAKKGEKVITLDDEERLLVEDDVVITNGNEPIALAGVMGLENTMVDEKTTSVILEAAYFEPKRIIKTSKRLDLRSESSLRFERGIDDTRVALGLACATSLLVELAKATVRKGIAQDVHHEIKQEAIHLSTSYLAKILGETIEEKRLTTYFDRYRYHYEKVEDGFLITPPSDRLDLLIPADIVEEIARIHGLNTIKRVQEKTLTNGSLTQKQIRHRRIRHFLADLGLHEVISYSLVAENDVTTYQEIGKPLAVMQPMSEDKKYLRQSLLNGLLETTTYNLARQMSDVHLFEMGHIFAKGVEKESLAISLSGNFHRSLWQKTSIKADFFLLKGLLEQLFNYLGMDVIFETSADKTCLHPYKQAVIKMKDKVIGYMGVLHPKVGKKLDIDDACVAEIDLSLFPEKPEALTYKPLSKYPSVSRDLAIVVDKNIPVGEIMAIIKQTVKQQLVSLELFDVYQGEHIDFLKQSLAFRLIFNDDQKTLDKETVDKLMKKVTGRLAYMYKAVVRN